LEAAVVAGRNVDGMNAVAAYIVMRPNALSEAENIESLKAQVSNALSSYKCPTEIHFTNQLPRTATGKLQRFKLRKQEQRPG